MQATRNIDQSLAAVFGNDAASYQRGIHRIVERAHELAKKDKWPAKAARQPKEKEIRKSA